MSSHVVDRLAIDEEARERSLRYLDFLEAYNLRRFPPVRDIGDYKDFQVTEAGLPRGSPGVSFTPGGPSWLAVDLVDLPAPPAPPADLKGWLTGPVVATAEPTLRHPDPVEEALMALLREPPDGDPYKLDRLDRAALEARGITRVAPGEVLEAARAAQAELDAAASTLLAWLESTWRPWAARWLSIEAGRSFYKRLFDLRVRLDRERETFELVWGFGRTRWLTREDGAPVSVDHPMLSVSAEVELERRRGQLRVTQASPLVVEASWTVGLPLSDRQGYVDQRATPEQMEIDPWGSGRREMVRSLLRSLDQDGTLLEGDSRPGAGPEAVADPDGWILYVRRRRPNLEGFIDAQRRLYADGVTPPAPFAALVVDRPSLLDQVLPEVDCTGDRQSEAARRRAETPERDLLPLPANEEQLEIVELARSRAGVTAQGPPGTGKSHTIANLVSHYVAHGKRVLVTAKKEQALEVLIDKVPEGIRDLCVPVLGADAAGRARLQSTVAEIAARSQRRPDRAAIARLEAELERIDSQYALTTNLLGTRRAAETLPAPHRPAGMPAKEWTPSAAAAWIAAHQALAGIPDSIDRDSAAPLSSAELVELDDLCARVGELDASAALAALPGPAVLPAAGRLATMRAEAGRLQGILAEVEDLVTSWEAVDEAGVDGLNSLADELDRWVDWHTKAAGTWVGAVLADAKDQSLASGWHEFAQAAARERDAVLAINRSLAAHAVSVSRSPDMPVPELTAGLNEARARFAAGKSVGALQRNARRALERCSTNGHPPATVEDIDLVMAGLARREQRQRMVNRWRNVSSRVGAPPLALERPVEDLIGERIDSVNAALQWSLSSWPELAQRLGAAGLRVPDDPDCADLSDLAHTCRVLRERSRLVEVGTELAALAGTLRDGAARPGASPLWAQLHRALVDQADTAWDALRAESLRLQELVPAATRRRALHERLQAAAPVLAGLVERGEEPLEPQRFEECWRWRQLDLWLEALDEGPQPAQLQARLEQLAVDRRRVTTDLVVAMAWASLSESIDDRRRTALNRFTRANARLGKGTGKYAPTWAAEARKGMVDAQDAVPVWIMPLHRALTSFRPTAQPPFDVVIVDEASQVGLLESPVLGLGRRAIIVGDDQQTSPENVGLDRQGVLDLIDDFLGAISDRRTRFDPDASLYDLGRQRFPRVVRLREHFRCLPRIIELSNQHWYSGSIIPLRDRPPQPGWQPIGTVFVPAGVRRHSDDTNAAEAQAVVDLIAELVADPAYDGMTFGVVTLLGSGQAPLISGMLLDYLGPRLIEERNLRVGEPADFQGDERDVVILSTVVAHDPDRRIGAMTGSPAARRINVAASRAANQMWMVHSVGVDAFHPDDPRRWLLEHCSTSLDEPAAKAAFDKTESGFERDVLARILAGGYTRVHAQHQVGGYRIDLVVEGPESSLAVECDGDYWHGPEMWDRDRARQTVLERAGWTFERIRGSSFYRDPDAALEPLWRRLAELKIPTGDWAGDTRPTPAHRIWPDDFPGRLEAYATSDTNHEPGDDHDRSDLDGSAPSAWVSTVPSSRDAVYDTRLAGPVGPVPARVRPRGLDPLAREVRQWGRGAGYDVGERGRLHPRLVAAWNYAFPDRPYVP
ncbi:MAG: AAA domain-containing protein [Acidimicrobiales bacterium]